MTKKQSAAKRAAEVKAEAARQLKFHQDLQKEDPSLWEQFQRLIGWYDEPVKPTKGKK